MVKQVQLSQGTAVPTPNWSPLQIRPLPCPRVRQKCRRKRTPGRARPPFAGRPPRTRPPYICVLPGYNARSRAGSVLGKQLYLKCLKLKWIDGMYIKLQLQ